MISFFVCLHHSLFSDGQPYTQFVDELRNNLFNQKFSPKSNDLFKFSQTKELMVKPTSSSMYYIIQ